MNLRFLTKENVVRVLCAAALLALPHNLFFKYVLPSSYQHGLLLDYFIPKFFLSDFFLIILTLWATLDFIREIFTKTLSKTTLVLTPLLSLATFWILLHGGLEVTWWWTGLLASFMVGRWLSQPWAKTIAKHWLLPTTLAVVLLIQAFFANVQWYTQRSIYEYSFFGETNLSAPNSLLKTYFTDGLKIPSYGTTPHPNILAGTTVFVWFWLFLFYRENKNTRFAHFLFSLASLATLSILALTDSLSANLSLILAGSIAVSLSRQAPTTQTTQNQDILKKAVIIFWIATALALAFISTSTITNTSITRRLNLQKIAFSAINQPAEIFLGTGWGGTLRHITANPDRTNEVARFAQPTHHAPSIWLLETGLVGLVILWLFIHNRTPKQLMLLAVITPTLILDHYWLTAHHAWWLLALLLPSFSWED